MKYNGAVEWAVKELEQAKIKYAINKRNGGHIQLIWLSPKGDNRSVIITGSRMPNRRSQNNARASVRRFLRLDSNRHEQI